MVKKFVKIIPFKVTEEEDFLITKMAENETNGNVSELIRRKVLNETSITFERIEKLLLEILKHSGISSKAIELKLFSGEDDKKLLREVKDNLKEYISKI